MKTRKYLYGIVELKGDKGFGNIGIGNTDVYTIQFKDVGAVVSDIPENYNIDVKEALIHEMTLRKVMETHPVIPAAFGVIAENELEILNMLKHGRMKFKSMLERISGKIQVNVRISWDSDILTDILKESEEIRRLSIQAKQNASDQSLKIELGRKVKLALDERGRWYQKEILSILEGFSCGFKENKITDQEVIMNASFLIDKERENKFYDKLDELESRHQGKLKFLAVGPLPPYNFARIKIKKMDFNMIEEARNILGLSREVSISEVNAAYNLLARKYHPDLHTNHNRFEEKFKKIKDAYELLVTYCKHHLSPLEKPKVEETLVIEEE